jgi:hypothetical protein
MPPWRRRGYGSSTGGLGSTGSALSTARLQGRASAGQAWWLAGMSGGCETIRSTGQTVLVAPLMACWATGGERRLRCMLCCAVLCCAVCVEGHEYIVQSVCVWVGGRPMCCGLCSSNV